jgi:hypothetical protein
MSPTHLLIPIVEEVKCHIPISCSEHLILLCHLRKSHNNSMVLMMQYIYSAYVFIIRYNKYCNASTLKKTGETLKETICSKIRNLLFDHELKKKITHVPYQNALIMYLKHIESL